MLVVCSRSHLGDEVGERHLQHRLLTERGKDFRPVAVEILRELDAKVLSTLGERQRNALTKALKGVMDL